MKRDAQALFQLARSTLQRAGAHERMAEAAARHLVRAEEQGLATHGMSRVPFYCGMLRKGRADGAAHPAMVSDRAAACLTCLRWPRRVSPAAIPAWGGTVVRGRIMMAMRKGERIPEGWALDRHGKPTTDPKEAIEHGSLFPIGGEVRLPGARRFAAEKSAKGGIEIPDELIAQIGKLCSTRS